MLIELLASTGVVVLLALLRHQRKSAGVMSRYHMALDAGQESFYLISVIDNGRTGLIEYQIKDCNMRGAALLGLSRAELIGTHLSSLFGDNSSQHLLGMVAITTANGIHQDQFCLPANSSLMSGWVQRRLVRHGDLIALTLHDISEAKVHEAELAQVANSDGLTRLANRHWLMEFLPEAIERARRNGHLLAVLLIDIDDFKNINDILGHEIGDDLLRSVAARLESLCGKHDSLVRLGGDEFTMVLEQVATTTAAETMAQRIVSGFDQAFHLQGDHSTVRVSIGISMYPDHGSDAPALMKFADIAMYAAKISGKARYCLYERHLSDTLNSRINARKALEHAVEHQEFLLFYQPRINAQTGEFCSMEALIRWVHPTRGLVLPSEFIPVAEECGLIANIGMMVIEKTCAQLAQWQSQHLPCLPVSINVSLKQFDQGNLALQLRTALQKYGIPSNLIEVELTESCMMSTRLDIAEHLAALQALGIKLLVDDFGTGYSSLSQLQQLDLDVLKVDRAFATELDRTVEGAVFFKAIISMAHALNMTVVAEGIETATQLRRLQELGCNEIQGFLIAPPLPAADIPALLVQKIWSPFFQQTEQLDA